MLLHCCQSPRPIYSVNEGPRHQDLLQVQSGGWQDKLRHFQEGGVSSHNKMVTLHRPCHTPVMNIYNWTNTRDGHLVRYLFISSNIIAIGWIYFCNAQGIILGQTQSIWSTFYYWEGINMASAAHCVWFGQVQRWLSVYFCRPCLSLLFRVASAHIKSRDKDIKFKCLAK